MERKWLFKLNNCCSRNGPLEYYQRYPPAFVIFSFICSLPSVCSASSHLHAQSAGREIGNWFTNF
nr:hypothetical protein Iba_chr01eCG2360 [Ipomoea batatas]